VAGRRLSLLKAGDEEEEIDADDHHLALIEFSTTSYAVLEREQAVVLKVKRRGPIDVDVRFRCLSFAHLHAYAIIYNAMLHNKFNLCI
jgi:hypothetical protein